ncbi:MAG: fasciclin domain-containing protein, partial [Planctomycetota bacterium]
DKSLVKTAAEAGKFSTLLAAAKAAGLAETLDTKGPFTVFAPTDDAFAKIPKDTLASLLKPENKQKLAAILKYHVVAGRQYSDQLLKTDSIKTLQGSTFTIGRTGADVVFNQSKLLAADIEASNGVVHVIDQVLMPPASPDPLATLRGAVMKGSSMFNHGDHHGCAELYQKTLTEMMDQQLSASVKGHMSSVLHSASQQHSATQRAWTLRHGIDQMYSQLASGN